MNRSLTHFSETESAGNGWDRLEEELAAARSDRFRLFFRDDDVAEDERSLCRLLDLFAEHQTALNLEIIPGQLTAAGSRRLRDRREQDPSLLDLHQHGWKHQNHEPTGRKCEFGPARSFEEQLKDLRAGRDRLLDQFGSAFVPVFTPPWNRYSDATITALVELGFHAFSALWRREATAAWPSHPVVEGGLHSLPATLDLIEWGERRRLRPVDQLLTSLRGQLADHGRAGAEAPPVGILLHHAVMDDAAFDFLARLLPILRESGSVEVLSFSTLLSDRFSPSQRKRP
ncbi:MAG: polysaccharide deacetylase family protein [Blastocatellia bacterium]